MYRPEWYEKVAGGRYVSTIAQDVYSTFIGSLDRDKQQQEDDIQCLEYVVANWKEDNFDYLGFNFLVKLQALTVLDIVKNGNIKNTFNL